METKFLTWEALDSAIRASGMSRSQYAKSVGVSIMSIGMVKAGKLIPASSETKLMKAIYGNQWERDRR